MPKINVNGVELYYELHVLPGAGHASFGEKAAEF
jgi:hypothetical protein